VPEGISLPRTDQATAPDLRHPPADAGLRGRHAGDPEGAVAHLEHQPDHGGEHPARRNQAVPVLGGAAMSAVAAETAASPRPRRARLTERARAERRLAAWLVGPAAIVMLAVTAYPIID